uniref:AARP2CN domain-containing protein n=1 Tax=Arundo donax TaxID=35708 RepID=A0A0A9EXB4_ARUDO
MLCLRRPALNLMTIRDCAHCLFLAICGPSLSANQLVHVSGAGDFQLGQIDVLKDPCPVSKWKSSDVMETEDDANQTLRIRNPYLLKMSQILLQGSRLGQRLKKWRRPM